MRDVLPTMYHGDRGSYKQQLGTCCYTGFEALLFSLGLVLEFRIQSMLLQKPLYILTIIRSIKPRPLDTEDVLHNQKIIFIPI